jgi:hypothetical protein
MENKVITMSIYSSYRNVDIDLLIKYDKEKKRIQFYTDNLDGQCDIDYSLPDFFKYLGITKQDCINTFGGK